MTDQITIGLARMHFENGEKRAFLPEFVSRLGELNCRIVAEYGYGSGMHFSEDDYRKLSPEISFAAYEKVFKQDYVLVLRCPNEKDLEMLKPGACIVSMMHYPTRPKRVALLQSLGVNSISLDSITDDFGLRLVENLQSVAWNGLEVAFQTLKQTYPSPGLENPHRKPIQVVVLGVGAVGIHAVQASSRYGNNTYWNSMAKNGVPGNIVKALEYDLTENEPVMKEILSQTDILVDSTQRPDASKAVIPNEWIGWMPEHAIIVDLSVDPYIIDADPPVVRGIEGIPKGNLDQYVFFPDDPNWDNTVPESISSKERRTTVTCYSWPGVHPKTCMRRYARQIGPLMEVLIKKGYEGLSLKGKDNERALTRASLKYFIEAEKADDLEKTNQR